MKKFVSLLLVVFMTSACQTSTQALPQVHGLAIDIVQDNVHNTYLFVDDDSIPNVPGDVGCNLEQVGFSQVNEDMQVIFSTCGLPTGEKFGVVLVGGDESLTQLGLLIMNDYGEIVEGEIEVTSHGGKNSWTLSTDQNFPLEIMMPADQLNIGVPAGCTSYTTGDAYIFTCSGNFHFQGEKNINFSEGAFAPFTSLFEKTV